MKYHAALAGALGAVGFILLALGVWLPSGWCITTGFLDLLLAWNQWAEATEARK